MAVIVVTAFALLLTLPFALRIRLAFNSYDKRFFVKVSLFFIHIITIRGVIANEIRYSWGNKVKTLKMKAKRARKFVRLGRLYAFPFAISGRAQIAYGNADRPDRTAFLCALLSSIAGNILHALDPKGMKASDLMIMPIYNQNIVNIKLDITFFSSPGKIISLLM